MRIILLRMVLLKCHHYPIAPIPQYNYTTMTPTKTSLQTLQKSAPRTMETILAAAVCIQYVECVDAISRVGLRVHGGIEILYILRPTRISV
jgi:hypothetical protein